ncbi:MAG TPA: hypothetical protein VJA45_14645 [Methylomirabilota bacterium]|nr:hypothetical protein [Methylomirabilota bacterium]
MVRLVVYLDRTPRCRAAILAYGGTSAAALGPRLLAVPLAALLG